MDDLRGTPVLLLAQETARETLEQVLLSRLALEWAVWERAHDQAILDRAMDRLARSQRYLNPTA
jgi:hypothetical protein